ncbi:Calx-beta domain-containing protein [Geminocystis sp.]|uniref:Calx-beta domain-containing protein n=1 Tax=Geminocystis sp. TaxID=2664100 RepID=UPI0035947C53
MGLRNTIVAGNFDTPNNAGSGTKNPDISGSVQGNGYNLIGNLTGASGTIGTGSDIVLTSGQTAGLGALANNGGVTKTHALLTGSRAINAGLTVLISQDLADIDGDGNRSEAVPFDQRGGNSTRVNGSSVDIGAFEFQTVVTTLPTLRINDISITEGNSGTKNAVFTVTRTGTPTGTITVNYATANGTATAGSDYVAKSGSLSFATNETSKTISVVINGDTTLETNETFFVNLSSATNATISDNQGLGTITNDDTNTNLLLVGNANNNNLSGGTGNDTLQGLGGNDTLRGLAGNDILDGGTGNDSMVGSTGNDTYYVNSTGDRVIENSNEGTDIVNSSISYVLGSNLENLTLTGTSNLTGIGNTLNNSITGNSGANIINGNNGNDTLNGAAGNDNLNGGNNNDRLDGGTGNDKLIGGLGNDVLLGGDGNDILIGGNGNDTLTVGTGGDRFVFKYADEGIDRITDFNLAQGDKIVISASGFDGGLTANANLTTAQFLIGSAATNASQRFIYNSSTGAFFFDQDGTGITSALQIATLNTGLALTSANIFVES